MVFQVSDVKETQKCLPGEDKEESLAVTQLCNEPQQLSKPFTQPAMWEGPRDRLHISASPSKMQLKDSLK